MFSPSFHGYGRDLALAFVRAFRPEPGQRSGNTFGTFCQFDFMKIHIVREKVKNTRPIIREKARSDPENTATTENGFCFSRHYLKFIAYAPNGLYLPPVMGDFIQLGTQPLI